MSTDIDFIGKLEYRPTTDWEPLHIHFRIWCLLTVEEPNVTVKYRLAIKDIVPLLEFMSKCNVEYSLVFIYIRTISY